jgi:hypothetical protein
MRKYAKIFVVYFPVLLIAAQVGVNLLSFIAPDWYYAAGFYLNTMFGTNVLFAVFLMAFTLMFKFCAVSRWCAFAELCFAVNWMVVKEDGLYNIMFQVIVGILALAATFWHYVKKFPTCDVSVGAHFIVNVFKQASCRKSLDQWDKKVRGTYLNHHHEKRNA